MSKITHAKQQEMLSRHLQDQTLSTFAQHGERLSRIAEDGPGDEADNALCRMMAHSILADLALSRYNTKLAEEATDAP